MSAKLSPAQFKVIKAMQSGQELCREINPKCHYCFTDDGEKVYVHTLWYLSRHDYIMRVKTERSHDFPNGYRIIYWLAQKGKEYNVNTNRS